MCWCPPLHLHERLAKPGSVPANLVRFMYFEPKRQYTRKALHTAGLPSNFATRGIAHNSEFLGFSNVQNVPLAVAASAIRQLTSSSKFPSISLSKELSPSGREVVRVHLKQNITKNRQKLVHGVQR